MSKPPVGADGHMTVAEYQATESEAALLAKILKLAKQESWLAYHHYDSRQSTGGGFPDVVLLKSVTLLVVELKSARGRVSREQQQWLDTLRLAGVDARVWRPVDWNEIVRTLRT